MKIITDTFTGLNTKADWADIKPSYCQVMNRMLPQISKAVKIKEWGAEFGGTTFDPAGYDLKNIFNFISEKLSMSAHSVSGDIFLFLGRVSSTFTLYAVSNGTTFNLLSLFPQFSTIQNSYCSTDTVCDCIPAGNTLRILSGAGDYDASSRLITGMWIGWIDRDMFNSGYSIPAGFYFDKAIIPNKLNSAEITLKTQVFDTSESHDNPTEYFYKYSLVYDYVQEGLLSDDTFSIVVYDDEVALFDIFLEDASTNKRLTSINIYRSLYRNTGFQYISKINLVKSSDSIVSGSDAAGMIKIFINDSDVNDYDFDGSETVTLRITVDTGTGSNDVFNGPITPGVIGTGNKIIPLQYSDLAGWTDAYSGYEVTAWSLTGSSSGVIASGDGDTLQFDKNVICFNNSNANLVRQGDLVYVSGYGYFKSIKIITDSSGNCSIGFSEDIIDDVLNYFSSKDYSVFTSGAASAVYDYSSGPDVAKMVTIDDSLLDNGEHPLENETSIHVNARYGQYYKGRLFCINSVLDPSDTAERHTNILNYSEYNQPDVIPVSNAIPFYDKFGSENVGIDLLFDSIIVLNKSSIFTINIGSITDPLTWSISESPHRVGPVSDKGYAVAAGSLFVLARDGIYRFSLNNLAESDKTPLESMKISEPINDVIEGKSLSQLESERIMYDPIENEIIYYSDNLSYAFNTAYETWREFSIGNDSISAHCINKDRELVAYYDSSESFINKHNESDAASKYTKYYTISEYKYEIAKQIKITYIASDTVTVNIYDAETGTLLTTDTVPASSEPTTKRIGIMKRAMSIYVEITTTANSTFELHRLVLETADSQE